LYSRTNSLWKLLLWHDSAKQPTFSHNCSFFVLFLIMYFITSFFFFFVTLSMLAFACLLLEKLARLKQAKEEAEKEIAEYRAQLEREFQKKVSDVSLYDYIWLCYTGPLQYSNLWCLTLHLIIQSTGDSGANVKRLEQETEAKIQNLKTEAAKISDDVVAMLRTYVTSVKN